MLKIASGALCAILTVTGASAQETVPWASSNVGGWNVAVDRTIGDSCFILAAFENDFVVRFQFNNRAQNVQFIIGNLKWGSVEDGEAYDMEVAFGAEEPWSGDGMGYLWNDILPSLVLSVPVEGERASAFLHEFAQMNGVKVRHDGVEVANLAFQNNSQAVAEMLACQEMMMANAGSLDPFEGSEVPAEPL
ncbi:hypothetical protein EF888_17865 [Silicimonas algicola]|uniref:Uncharacterized protein n=1 Tax=Silicimonas algicola TaxID=1826607 RepID=A0A316G5B8_9RHOB|nr:hypothetical protein [Silicimonas algicola]AZQ68831.1 hypothetical protein EF888_17865 [Silicimonas algicola]PWK56084.1 hypothetical protein C8D95_105149 [Silicimonas algicola]